MEQVGSSKAAEGRVNMRPRPSDWVEEVLRVCRSSLLIASVSEIGSKIIS